MLRPLSEMLLELATGLTGTDVGGPALAVSRLELDLPIEVSVRPAEPVPELLADLPRWRWSTPFDQVPSRMRVRLEVAR